MADLYSRLPTAGKKELATHWNLLKGLEPEDRDATAKTLFWANRQNRDEPVAAPTVTLQPAPRTPLAP